MASKESRERADGEDRNPLPDYYETVAADVIAFCGASGGRVWVDLGSGPGGLGLALLEKIPDGVMALLDPDADALRRALDMARQRGHASRVVAVVGPAEKMPLPSESVDVVVSRGSFYFWQDRAQGLREVWRVLRLGGRAMIGGGLGTGYPAWARTEFIRRQRESQRSKGAEAMRTFREARSQETFRRLAAEANLPKYEVVGEGGLDTGDPQSGVGIWLRFEKSCGGNANRWEKGVK